jgi:hypothetical protein
MTAWLAWSHDYFVIFTWISKRYFWRNIFKKTKQCSPLSTCSRIAFLLSVQKIPLSTVVQVRNSRVVLSLIYLSHWPWLSYNPTQPNLAFISSHVNCWKDPHWTFWPHPLLGHCCRNLSKIQSGYVTPSLPSSCLHFSHFSCNI